MNVIQITTILNSNPILDSIYFVLNVHVSVYIRLIYPIYISIIIVNEVLIELNYEMYIRNHGEEAKWDCYIVYTLFNLY